MKIHWNQNPLATVIELNDQERKSLRLRLAIEEQEETGSIADEGRLDRLLAECEKELGGSHGGDCICWPCSCLKCHAESLLGVDTIEGLDKHEGASIASAFAPSVPGGPDVSIAEAIERLACYRPVKGPAWDKFTDEEFQVHVPRWTEEAKRAHAWLLAYRREKFG